jgi:O-antigen/teichoic acid export membrane protein
VIYTDASISNLALVYGSSLVSANVLLTLWFYQNRPELRPQPHLDKQHVRPLLAVGLQFFTIQLAVLVIFTTDKILITQLFSPKYVTQYEVVFKLFSVITFAHGLISAPLWSAYTDAYHREDFAWIRRVLTRQLIIFLATVILSCVMVLSAHQIIGIWIGHNLNIPSQLIVAMGGFVLISTWNSVFATFINGVGKIRIQLYTAIAAMIINIPLSIVFAKYTSLGVSGIVIGTICSLLIAGIVLPIHTYNLLQTAVRKQAA